MSVLTKVRLTGGQDETVVGAGDRPWQVGSHLAMYDDQRTYFAGLITFLNDLQHQPTVVVDESLWHGTAPVQSQGDDYSGGSFASGAASWE
jgi:hypothetical protein